MSHHPLQLARVRADVQAGAHVRTGHVQLERGYLLVARTRLDERRELLRGGAHDVRDQRHRPRALGSGRCAAGVRCPRPQPREARKILGEIGLQSLVGESDRVDQARRRLPQARRGVPGAGRARDRLGDVGGERELGLERRAEGLARGDHVERARAVDHAMGQLEAAERHAHAGAPACEST